MDVRAIVLLGPSSANAPETLGGVPIALLDVLGQPVLHRITERLCRAGIRTVRIIGDAGPQAARFVRRAQRHHYQWESASSDSLWRAAQRAFSDFAQAGADLVLILRAGPYAEVDFERLLQFHLDQNNRVTAVTTGDG
jgi:NDP-sugar pyrophosphorylase family protein